MLAYTTVACRYMTSVLPCLRKPRRHFESTAILDEWGGLEQDFRYSAADSTATVTESMRIRRRIVSGCRGSLLRGFGDEEENIDQCAKRAERVVLARWVQKHECFYRSLLLCKTAA